MSLMLNDVWSAAMNVRTWLATAQQSLGTGRAPKRWIFRTSNNARIDEAVDAVGKMRLAGLMVATDIGLQILDNVPAFYQGTSPNKFFDYIAAGLPVLINYPGWLADLVGRHGHQVLVDLQEIGDQLGLTEKTVKNYLATIFSKLNITRRTQAAALYVEAGLISAERTGDPAHNS